MEKEGWFDPYSLLTLLKRGALEKGAKYVQAEVVNFIFDEAVDLIIEGVRQATQQVIKGVVVSN